MGTAAAERRTAISACRGALQAAHNAANLANIVDKEAAQMLRTAEGMARSAVSRLEFLGRELANKKKKQEKDVKCTDASMESTAAAAESAPLPAPKPRASRRRRGRGAREAVPPPAATEPVLPVRSSQTMQHQVDHLRRWWSAGLVIEMFCVLIVARLYCGMLNLPN